MASNAAKDSIEILEIMKKTTMDDGGTVGDVVYRSRAGKLNITCRFIGRISDDAANEFSRVFHDALDRAEKDQLMRQAS